MGCSRAGISSGFRISKFEILECEINADRNHYRTKYSILPVMELSMILVIMMYLLQQLAFLTPIRYFLVQYRELCKLLNQMFVRDDYAIV
jgi:hypothetical protein